MKIDDVHNYQPERNRGNISDQTEGTDRNVGDERLSNLSLPEQLAINILRKNIAVYRQLSPEYQQKVNEKVIKAVGEIRATLLEGVQQGDQQPQQSLLSKIGRLGRAALSKLQDMATAKQRYITAHYDRKK